ncbi:MAG: hypothetical protein WBB19_05750 [Desulforhopalus sp.]
MNSLNTFYFPGTDIYSIRQYPLFLLFQKMHLIKPVEKEPADSGEEPSDSFIKSGLCQVHTPCPLGENRNRFLHLVEDIKNRKDDYAAQLSSLILAGKSNAPDTDEDSERNIIHSMMGNVNQKAQAKQLRREEKLWQARLVLAIGEILDKEEEEIARNLAILEDDQAGLFKELHGDGDDESTEDENPFAELCQLENNLSTSASGNSKNRFNGWKTLFLEGDFNECQILLAAGQDAGDILLESYEQKTTQSAPQLASFELPGLIGWSSSEAFQSVVTFTEKNSALLASIQENLAELLQKEYCKEQEQQSITAFAAIADKWNAQLESVYPAKKFGRIPVRFYLFPGCSCSSIIGNTHLENGEPKNGLLVVAA